MGIAGQEVRLGTRTLRTEDGVVRTPCALQGSATSLGFAPALVFLIVAGFLHVLLGIPEVLMIRLSQPILYANTIANTWLLGDSPRRTGCGSSASRAGGSRLRPAVDSRSRVRA